MKPTYVKDFHNVGILSYNTLMEDVPWVNRDAPREECFMASNDLEYTYGKGENARTYRSVPMHPLVQILMDKLNECFLTNYNVCFLNYYKSGKQHLGWHADDSPEMDADHPIAVISFGAERYIWVKEREYKGNIPDEDKYLLENGSLFIMPAGFQKDHLHKIPKHDRECGGRISLTFRRFVNK
jgi:alkylated DNA repair dioxygenase AlkB